MLPRAECPAHIRLRLIELKNYVAMIYMLLATIWCTGLYWGYSPRKSGMAGSRSLAFQDGKTTESLASGKFASHLAASDVEMMRIPN